MKKVLLTSCALALVGVAGLASAGVITDQGTITVNVESGCTLLPIPDVEIGATDISENGAFTPISVLCNDQLPYTLEVSSDANGFVPVTDTTNGRTYQVQILQEDQVSIWSTKANQGEVNAVGSGQWQDLWAIVKWTTAQNDAMYGMSNYKPQQGNYAGTVNVKLTYL